ncbi:hypothetical protein BJ138DRAFT_180221 [Hygrophoropsis aurantiaca]|uniref:Uncharacterized protein n=1 Tax=Hygrophoropsis aurantiaca TaxID=72124 RepID=A0ACB8A9Q6_9AGAM|nr:hypothetical protein BJ138DRAFT_180221 [Hygrophoropsis aurantiaca]
MTIDVERDNLQYDVIVVGGSIAGCATALSIFRSNPNASILVLDNADPDTFKIGESLPAAAKRDIAYLCPQVLERVAESKDDVCVKCTGNASSWGSSELEETYAIMNPFGMGWHLDRARFDEILRENMATAAPESISLIKGTFTEIGQTDGGARWALSANDLASETNHVYTSTWVVDASGRKAAVARKLGSRTVKDDALLAFYAVFVRSSMTEDCDYRTLIEACQSGWWYSSPLPGDRRVVAYHTDDSNATSRDARTLDGFINLLHGTTTHISKLVAESEYDISIQPNTRYPVCTAAGSSRLQPLCQEDPSSGARWCAVGDAAMAFDPLSSQGMITAMKMGCVIGDIIAKDILTVGPNDIPSAIIPQLYSQVWSKYIEGKTYFYNSEKRFDGDFWRIRR